MDPRSRHTLLEDAVRYSFNEPPKQPNYKTISNPKRHGIYFPSGVKIQLEEKETIAAEEDDDDYSTWEFKAPVAPSKRSSTSSTACSACSTPAQEMVSRFRAGMPLQHVLSSDSSLASTSSRRHRKTKSSFTVQSREEREYVSIATAAAELKPVSRQSRTDALMETAVEATQFMRAQGAGPDGPIACRRIGCHDVLRNLDALMHHLHIHNLDGDNVITCPRCNNTYETEWEMVQHVCRRRSRIQSFSGTGIRSPIKETFAKVMSKVSFCA